MAKLGMTSAMAQAQAALEVIARRDRKDQEARYDWYGAGCPCGIPIGECRLHPRARLNQRPGSTPLSPYSEWWRVFAFIGGRGSGKMLALDTAIPTPSGWTTMGEIRTGDQVFDESGRICNVTFVSDVEVPETCYRMTFCDGSSIDACSEHQWVSWTHAERKSYLRSPYEETWKFPAEWPSWRLTRKHGPKSVPQEAVGQALTMRQAGCTVSEICRVLGYSRTGLERHLEAGEWIDRAGPVVYADSPGPKIRTTHDIVKTLTFGKRGDTNHCIPLTGPLQTTEVSLPIPPYTLGVWLGDGTASNGSITSSPEDQPEIRAALYFDGFETTERSDPLTIGTIGLHVRLRDIGLIDNKHIPEVYFRSSPRQRLLLLQGLMDTDGGVEAASTVSFTNTNKKLADGVYELVVSLGMKAFRDQRPSKLNGKVTGTAYRVSFRPTMTVFKLARKKDKLPASPGQELRHRHRMIEKAEKIPSVPMRCISVDSPHSMYLAGKGMVPTHNTFMGAQYVLWSVLNGFAREIIFVNATIRDTIDLMVEGPSGIIKVVPSWLMQPGNEFAKFYPSKARVDFKNGAKAYLRTSEEPDGLRGPNIDLVWGDEPGKWVKQKETWDQVGWIMRNRITPNPRCILTGTPMPSDVMFELEDKGQDPTKTGVTYVTCHMDENAAHLDPQFLAERHERYDGTLMGQQEMAGILIRRKPGALWGPEDLDKNGFLLDLPPTPDDLEYIGVGLDPASGSNDEDRASEAGIVVASRRRRNGNTMARGVVLADCSCSGHPSDWGKAAIRAYVDYNADEIVYEINQGGEMIVNVVRTTPAQDGYPSGINIPMHPVYASRGKTTRAEESQVLYQAGRVQHIRGMDLLERQMIKFVRDKPGQKLDRVDALVWILKRAVLEQDFIQDTGRIICGMARPELDWIGQMNGRI